MKKKTLSTKKAIKKNKWNKERKQGLDQESDQGKKKKKLSFLLDHFHGRERVFFSLTFLFFFINSHLSLLAQRVMLYVVLPLVDASLEVTAPVLPLLANITVRITHASIEPRYVM